MTRWLRHRWRQRRRRVVRVQLGAKLYAYRASRPCRIGERVEIDPQFAWRTVRRVEGFGRRGWLGRLKEARPVEQGSGK